jgi:hypothetical protein
MSYSRDVKLFWELLELSDAKLIVDNDMCMITYSYSEDDDEPECQSFDFGPKDIARIFGEKLDIHMEEV